MIMIDTGRSRIRKQIHNTTRKRGIGKNTKNSFSDLWVSQKWPVLPTKVKYLEKSLT